ncbi:MAG TPA: helix-turn-helix domain-containing protein [Patescibacteria group bacterium]
MKERIPTYDICNLLDNAASLQDVVVYDMPDFLQSHQDLVFPHRHSFYQVLYVESGAGKHIIDFETYPVKGDTLYFMAPGQVHTWLFEGSIEGCLINFNDTFFSSFLLNSHYLSDFPFFSGNSKYGVYHLTPDAKKAVMPYFEILLKEQGENNLHKNDLMRTTLLQLFLYISRRFVLQFKPNSNITNYNILRNFEKLIEQNYIRLKLPKEYAELLFITPNHLNALCKQVAEKSAGEMIRERVLLEAKRSLVNGNESISEIAYKLNFEDNSYFARFFKKYVFVTPEEFRKNTQLNK